MNDYYEEYKKRSAMLELVRPADEVYAFINEQLELHERYMKLMRENAPDEEYEKFDSPFWRDNVRKFVGFQFPHTGKIQSEVLPLDEIISQDVGFVNIA